MQRIDRRFAIPLTAAAVAAGMILVAPGAASAGEQEAVPPRQSPVSSISATLPDAVTSLIQKALSLRNSQLVTSTTTTKISPALVSAYYTTEYQGAASTEMSGLQARKSRLAVHDEVFNGTKTGLTVESYNVSGNSAVATVLEHTEMTYRNYADGTTPPPSSYEYQQTVGLSKTAAGWAISSIKATKDVGIPPVTVLASPVISPSVNTAPNSVTATPASAVASTAGNSTFTNKDMSTSPKSAPVGGSQPKFGVHPMGYNILGAENYAINWAFGRNSAYMSYADDCTNFVSQAMDAYGWSRVARFYQNDTSWWTTPPFLSSYPWVGSQAFANFAGGSGRISYLSYLSDLGPADILQANWDPAHTNQVTHTTIVTYKNGNDIRVTYHTNDTLNRSIWDLYDSSPGAAWYALRD